MCDGQEGKGVPDLPYLGEQIAKATTLQDEVGRIETNLVRSHDLLDRIVPSESATTPESTGQPAMSNATEIVRRCLQAGVRLNERLEELGARTGVI